MVFNTDLTENILAVLPEIALVILAAIVLFIDLYSPESRRHQAGYWAGIGMIGVALLTPLIPLPGNSLDEQLVLGGMLRQDEFTQIFRVMIYLAAGLCCLLAVGDNRLRYKGEFYLILIVASIGGGLMGGAGDLIMVFVGLETLSISLYVLAGFARNDDRSAEAGMKYFLLGAFSTAFMLYGLSLLYGFTGQTNLYEIGRILSEGALTDPPIILALLLVLVGFGFKISIVPFHFWTPDVYEGAPTPMTAYVSVASKAASFALLLRFLLAIFPPSEILVGANVEYSDLWVPLITLFAIITMTLGNLLALVQKNIKRMLAYSSIAQAGYTLIGVAAIATTESGDGAASVAFYMFMYVLTNILAFGCVLVFANATGSENIADMAGLGRRNLWLALMLAIALLSLSGIPPAAGFIGKFLLFRAAVDAGLIWLAAIAVINSIIGLYYYLVVVKVMFFDPSADEDREIPMSVTYGWALGISTLGVVLLGTVLAPVVINWASDAGINLFLQI
jgi:NADH-quinone oxidoreductase subunit N